MTFEIEVTKEGEQGLIAGVRAVSVKDRLRLMREAPLMPRKPQKTMNIGLFDEDLRNQLDLFLHTRIVK